MAAISTLNLGIVALIRHLNRADDREAFRRSYPHRKAVRAFVAEMRAARPEFAEEFPECNEKINCLDPGAAAAERAALVANGSNRPKGDIPADATTVRNDPNREHSAGEVELVLTALLRQSLFARR